jgi:hypothetical protein
MKDIPGYKYTYSVDVYGNVFSKHFGKLRQLKPSKQRGKYHMVMLCSEGKMKGFLVHRLVAMCYLDDYSDELQVNHKNLNGLDNRVENLEMVTAKQNTDHFWKEGKVRPNAQLGEQHYKSKLTEEQVMLIKKEYGQGNISQRALAKEYGVCQATIKDIVLGICWKHLK